MTATATAVAFVVYSCGGNQEKKEKPDFSSISLQTVEDMFVVNTENGKLKMRMEGGKMERYVNDTSSYEIFPDGFSVFLYTDGQLETMVTSDKAKHEQAKSGSEVWMAFGNVVIKNIKKQETMETDTIYWDREKELIYTDCYVRMYSPQGYMQGYGIESDQKANNAVILRPFNSYGVVERDTTEIFVDTVNFIGPLQRK